MSTRKSEYILIPGSSRAGLRCALEVQIKKEMKYINSNIKQAKENPNSPLGIDTFLDAIVFWYGCMKTDVDTYNYLK